MAENQYHDIVQITLRNRIGYEKIAMACSESFAEMFGFPKDRIEDLKTIVGEAFTNAMRHGNKGRSNAKVLVSMSCNNETIQVSVTDEGAGLNKQSPHPDVARIIENNEKMVGGLGLFLIKQLADKVEFKKGSDNSHMIHMALKMKAQAKHAESK